MNLHYGRKCITIPVIKNEKCIKTQSIQIYNGEICAIESIKHLVESDYQEKWTEEIFIIRGRFLRNDNPVYNVKDWDGKEEKGMCNPNNRKSTKTLTIYGRLKVL